MKPIVFSFIIACSYFLVGCDVQNKDSLVRYSSFGEVVSLKSEKIEVPPVLLNKTKRKVGKPAFRFVLLI